jgi:hypothetical protein
MALLLWHIMRCDYTPLLMMLMIVLPHAAPSTVFRYSRCRPPHPTNMYTTLVNKVLTVDGFAEGYGTVQHPSL